MSEIPEPKPPSGEFVALLTGHQSDILAFLISMMPGHPDVEDILQETNLILWNKRENFIPGSNFRAWAFRIARFEVYHLYRKQKKEGWIPLDEDLAEIVAEEIPDHIENSTSRLAAMESCLNQLRPQDRRLLEYRYSKGTDLADYSRATGRSVSALSVTLFRLRAILRKCITQSPLTNRN